MAAKRTGLGRGIGALIPTTEGSQERPVDVFFPGAGRTVTKTKDAAADARGGVATITVEDAGDDATELVAVPGARLIRVDPRQIVPNPRQPRTVFDEDDLAELVHSVREFGVLQPVVVRENAAGEY